MTDDTTTLPPLAAGTSALASGRRSVLGKAGIGAAALGAFAAGLFDQIKPAKAAVTDADILTFALNLEYLEAEYYLRAVTGSGLADADTTALNGASGTPGAVSVPSTTRGSFSTRANLQYAQEVAGHELSHVRFLRAALSAASAPVQPRPAIDLMASFTAAAQAAGVVASGQTFNPFANENSFLLGAYIFEDVGVTAYGGAAALINTKAYLTAAASILGVEAYHAGEIRTRVVAANLAAYANKISGLRAAASGAADDYGPITNGRLTIVPVDANGLAFTRTTTQVLNIVYLGSASTPGGFFPSGMNGTIR